MITPVETGTNLKNDTNDELVNENLYKKIIVPLRYLCNTRLDIFQSVRLVSRFMEKPRTYHLLAFKRILRYIKSMKNHEVLMQTHKIYRRETNVYPRRILR